MTDASTILVVIGTRPEAIKMAPVVHALRRRHPGQTRVLVTSQHRELLEPALRFFGLVADRDLDALRPGQTLAELSARVLASFDAALVAEAPALVIAQGDTTTVLMAALGAFYRGIPFAHVEAGLRAPDVLAPFPEEMNRRLVSQLTTLHLAPTEHARDNLLAEGVPTTAVHATGNPGLDALAFARARRAPLPFVLPPGKRLVLVTAHRRENAGAGIEGVCRAVLELGRRRDVVVALPCHSNPNVRGCIEQMLAGAAGVLLLPPLDYPEMVAALEASTLVLTDSGGLQEEAPALGKPVLVLRATTERCEGVAAGAAILVGTDAARIVAETTRLLGDPVAYARMAVVRNPYGDGQSADRIGVLVADLVARSAPPFSR